MTEVSRNLRNVFFHKVPPILKLEVGFFSDRKKFFADFRKYCNFFLLDFFSSESSKHQKLIQTTAKLPLGKLFCVHTSLSQLPSRESEVKVKVKVKWSETKKVLWFFLVFIEIKSRWKKIAVFSKICEKLFSIGKKSDFKFQNRGYFPKKNVPQISWNFGHN